VALLESLVQGRGLPSSSSGFLSLEVDSINDVFLDLVGDTVLEFDDAGVVLVEDYVEDVAEALGLTLD